MSESPRAAYVHALENELAFLERQPTPKADRIADVKKQLDHYSKNPEKRERETAVKKAAEPEGVKLEHDADAKRADKPAKKAAPAAAKKAAPAKRAAAKKTAKA